jgi:hypothetical protein
MLREKILQRNQRSGIDMFFLITSVLGIDTIIFIIDTISSKSIVAFSGSFGGQYKTMKKIIIYSILVFLLFVNVSKPECQELFQLH